MGVSMGDVEQEVDNAVAAAMLPPGAVRKCDKAEASHIVKQAMTIFVEGNPRSWWLSLRGRREYFPYETVGFDHLREHVPLSEGKFWFVPETEEMDMPVYECDIDGLVRVLARCFLFEYYVLGKAMNWLIINTDHGQLIVCKRVHV